MSMPNCCLLKMSFGNKVIFANVIALFNVWVQLINYKIATSERQCLYKYLGIENIQVSKCGQGMAFIFITT